MALVAASVPVAVARAAAAGGSSPVRWGAPFQLAGYAPEELLAPQVALDARGDALVAFTRERPERPDLARAFALTRTAGGTLSAPRSLAGGASGPAQVLAAGAGGSAFAVLVGRAGAGQRCCSSVQVRGIAAGGGIGAARTLFTSVQGDTAGALVGLPGRMLAAVGSIDGVWVSQQGSAGFAPARALGGQGQQIDDLAADASADGRSVVAWTVADPHDPEAAPPAIELATGTAAGAPSATRLAAVLPAGRGVEELAVLMDGRPVLGWIEGWVDSAGVAHTSIRVMPLGGSIRSYSVAGAFVSGLSLAGDGRGGEVLSFRACTRDGRCDVRAALKPPRGVFGPARVLGLTDATSTPSLAVLGQRAVVAWVREGTVESATADSTSRAFGAAAPIVRGGDTTSVTLGAGTRSLLAAVVRGVLVPRLDGAVLAAVPVRPRRKPARR